MSPIFTTIQFGPFSTAYHRGAVNEEFREALNAFLTNELLPQVDEPFETTEGTLTPEVSEDRFCGTNSLVRDVYRLQFAFARPTSKDEIDIQIRRRPDGTFTPRYRHMPLYLWTAKRSAKSAEVQNIARQILDGEKGLWSCPFCAAELRVTDEPGLFDLTCTGGCFNLSYHRDPQTMEFKHGHFFASPRA